MELPPHVVADMVRRGLIPADCIPEKRPKPRVPRFAPRKSRGVLDSVEVPVPPSANNAFPDANNRRVASASAKKWRKAAYPILSLLRAAEVYPVTVRLWLMGCGINRNRDLGNIEKLATDALKTCGVIVDDCLKYVTRIDLRFLGGEGAARVLVQVLPTEEADKRG